MKAIKQAALALLLCMSLCARASAAIYPVDVRLPSEVGGTVYKVYELESERALDELPRGGFELRGVTYTLQDVTMERADGVIRCTLIFTPKPAESETAEEKAGTPVILWAALAALLLGAAAFAVIKLVLPRRRAADATEGGADALPADAGAPGEPPVEAEDAEAPEEPQAAPEQPEPAPVRRGVEADVYEYPKFS